MEEKKSKKSKKKKNRSAAAVRDAPPSSSASPVAPVPDPPDSASASGLQKIDNVALTNGSAPPFSLHTCTSSSSSLPSSSRDASPADPRGSSSNGDVPVENKGRNDEEAEEEDEERESAPSQVPVPRLSHESDLSSSRELVHDLRMALASETESKQALQIVVEELRSSHDTIKEDFELRIKQLMNELIQLRELEKHQKITEINLRGEIQNLQDESMRLRTACKLQRETEAAKHLEVEQLKEENIQLREDNIQLVKKVEEMNSTIEQLQQERRQLATKVSAMQMGINQLEREAAIHSHVKSELSSEKSKGWFGWGSRKMSAVEAAALAEDSRLQMVAAAGMVEKLVSENSALVEKINEQTVLIDRITRKYSHLIEMQSIGHMESLGPENEKYVSIPEGDVVEQTKEVLPVIKDKSLIEEEILPMFEDKRQLLEEEGMTTISDKSGLEEIIPLIGEGSPSEGTKLKMMGEDLHTTVPEMINLDFQHVPPQTTKSETPQSAILVDNDIKPFSDAPIMGAPIRLFSFIAKYVSGADLVNT